MITMMISIIPSDMALSPRGGRRMELRPAPEKSISRRLVPAKEPEASFLSRHSGAMPTGPREARPDDRLRVELRCAIAHRRISSFRVRAGARPGMTSPRNSEPALVDEHGIAGAQ